MLYFDVIVYPQRVEVNELVGELKKYDVSVNVDGEIWRYRIYNKTGDKKSKTWFGRGTQQAYYHAKNSGCLVEFQRVSRSQYVARRKVHANQLKLFE